jgi:hypothetical protein
MIFPSLFFLSHSFLKDNFEQPLPLFSVVPLSYSDFKLRITVVVGVILGLDILLICVYVYRRLVPTVNPLLRKQLLQKSLDIEG